LFHKNNWKNNSKLSIGMVQTSGQQQAEEIALLWWMGSGVNYGKR